MHISFFFVRVEKDHRKIESSNFFFSSSFLLLCDWCKTIIYNISWNCHRRKEHFNGISASLDSIAVSLFLNSVKSKLQWDEQACLRKSALLTISPSFFMYWCHCHKLTMFNVIIVTVIVIYIMIANVIVIIVESINPVKHIICSYIS